MPTLSVISQLRLSTSPSKISTRESSAHTTQRKSLSNSSSETAPQVVLLVQLPSRLFTHSILQELVSLPMLDQVEQENSLESLTASKRSPKKMEHWDSTEVSESQSQELSSTVLLTSECMIPQRNNSFKMLTCS